MDEKAFKSWMVAALRRISYRWPGRYKVKAASRRGRNQYECGRCEGLFGTREVALDHISPVVDPSTGFVDWNTYIERLFVPESGYQVLCKPCHQAKSKEENHDRKDKKRLR